MEIIEDKNFDYKRVVIDGYNGCADKYMTYAMNRQERSLDFIFRNIPRHEKVLDFGCGSGVPVSKELAEKYNVVGIDISERQIELAKTNVSGAEFINADILDVHFESDTFSAIVSFYTLFHLPKEEHDSVLRKFYEWLKPSGILLVTVGKGDEPPQLNHDFFGVTMFWCSYCRSDYLRMIEQIGFRIIHKPEFEYTDEGYPIIIGKKDN